MWFLDILWFGCWSILYIFVCLVGMFFRTGFKAKEVQTANWTKKNKILPKVAMSSCSSPWGWDWSSPFQICPLAQLRSWFPIFSWAPRLDLGIWFGTSRRGQARIWQMKQKVLCRALWDVWATIPSSSCYLVMHFLWCKWLRWFRFHRSKMVINSLLQWFLLKITFRQNVLL